MFKDEKDFYRKSDKELLKLLKEINKEIELSMSRYENKIIEELTKKFKKELNFYISTEILEQASNQLFGRIDELNQLGFTHVFESYYNIGVDMIKENISKDLKLKKLTEKMKKKHIKDILSTLVLGRGLNYMYSDEILRRKDYFTSQLANSYMGAIQREIERATEKQLENMIASDFVDKNSDLVRQTVTRQKKSMSKFTESMITFFAIKSMEKAFQDNLDDPIYVRHAEVDSHTCEYCLSQDKTEYESSSAIDIPSHDHCRCWIEIVKGDKKDI